jgi:thioredoxin reductase
MELLIEQILTYSLVIIFTLSVVIIYMRRKSKASKIVGEKIKKAKLEGLYEPVSLHPVIDINDCIQTGACIAACPEKDILGINNGKATTINASQCIGHGACFHACPTEAITLCIGTEKRGVELPHVNQDFETNIPGIYIAGELGGMGLIKNAVEQGKQAVENIAKKRKKISKVDYDLVIVGSGPAGISGALMAKKNNMNALILEQDTLGGTVSTFPRQKIVMTSAMNLPLYGKVKLTETSKKELLDIWNDALRKNELTVHEKSKVENIEKEGNGFNISVLNGKAITTANVLLAIGRRGTPRKLNIPGEVSEKVAYRLIEPENITNKNIIVVGGGDAGIESALMLSENNTVSLVYRDEGFSAAKVKNREKILDALKQSRIISRSNNKPVEILEKEVVFELPDTGEQIRVENDLVYIFIGGELPTQFLKKIGLEITKKFGDPILSH